MFKIVTYYRNQPTLNETAATWEEAAEMTRKHMVKGAIASEFGR
jgi:hypothetical protein